MDNAPVNVTRTFLALERLAERWTKRIKTLRAELNEMARAADEDAAAYDQGGGMLREEEVRHLSRCLGGLRRAMRGGR